MARFALLTPLRRRDFRLLYLGMTVSLLGDGIYLVALAWQVYDLTSSPTALSLVGLAFSAGMVGFLLLGGAAADRFDRRRQMVLADSVRLLCLIAMGTLSITGTVEVWHLAVLALLYGAAQAFFSPAFVALIPLLVPPEDLVQANALQEIVRPAMWRLAGPALGGVLVSAFGAGTAFLVDAGTFAFGIVCVLAIRRPVQHALRAGGGGIREGLAWAREAPWFWATLVAVALSIMCTQGPQEVLLPLVVRQDMHEGAGAYGLVLAAAGVGGVLGGLWMSGRGLPPNKLRFTYLAWGLSVTTVAGYAIASNVWQLALLTFLFGGGIACGMVVWATLIQRRVPPEMLGRVAALDWMVSIGLTPVSFALTGPVAALVGHDATLLGGGLLGGALILAIFALVPGLRRDDADAISALGAGRADPLDVSAEPLDVLEEPRVGDGGRVHSEDLDAVLRG